MASPASYFSAMEITAYLKTTCSWSNGIRAILAKYQLPHTTKDIIKHPEFRAEMEQLSRQTMSPCVMVNGHMLADISGPELENWLVANDFIEHSTAPAPAPVGGGCGGV